jgi:hypothetical protein
MKTAVEKARELVDKHRTYLRMADKYDYLDSEDEIYLATQCALISVDEIQGIKSVYHDEKLYDYYEQVKEEINKL